MKGNLGSIETKAIHAGEPRPRIAGAVVMPVFQSATYQYAGEKNYDDVRYIRLNNTPNQLALAEKLSALENAEDALVTASGMAAISTSLLTFLGNGDHFLAQDCLYGGTHDFVTRDIEKFGISYDFIDGNDPDSWKRKLKPTTRAIYVETISNPLMQVPDLESVVSFAKSHGLVSMIDNTFASPVNFRPLELGFDLSLHRATKYLNGHSDIVAGAVVGQPSLLEKVTQPSTTSHSGLSAEDRRRLGISDGLIRLSVGIEATEDLMEDFRQALETQSNRTPSHRSQERAQVHE